jgi:Ca2+-binding EF-hand superfamily protein
VLAPLLRNKDSTDECAKTFELFDVNSVGSISFLNLKKVAQDVGENLTD